MNKGGSFNLTGPAGKPIQNWTKQSRLLLIALTASFLMFMLLLPNAFQRVNASAGTPGKMRAVANIGNHALEAAHGKLTVGSSVGMFLPALNSLIEPQVANRNGDGDDPDVPPFARGRIDKGTYMDLRAFHITTLRGFELGKPYDPSRRALAIQQMEQQFRSSPAVNPTSWTPIGPAPIPNGQTSPSVAVSGRITAIDIHPTNPNIAYVGTAQGGLYRTTSGGMSWTAIMDTAQSLAIGAVTIDPINPSIVFVGTGESNLSGDSFFGVGLYRINNADTASPTLNGPFETRVDGTGTTASNGHAFVGTAISKIVVDPANDNRIFVGNTLGGSGVSGGGICCGGTNPASAFIGLYFSNNALSTATFSRVSGVPGSGVAGVSDIVFEPGSSDNLLVGSQDFGSPPDDSGLYRTTNASVAPGSSPTFSSPFNPGAQINIKLAINKVSSTVTAYAATGEGGGRLRKSTDGGATWSAVIASASGFCGGQCFYDIVVEVDPANANVVYLGGNVNGVSSRLLARSTDGGATFNDISSSLHADQHALSLAPSNTSILYNGNDGGVWKSTDSGASWTSLNNTGFNATQFESLAVHPTDQNFSIGGTQDNGTEWYKPNQTWTRADFGDGGFSAIDQGAVNTTNVTMYHTYFNQTNNLIGFARVTSTTCATEGEWVFRGFGSVDPTIGCESVPLAAANGIAGTDSVLFYAPLALGPGTPNTLYFGTDRLYRSTNRGDNMSQVSQGPITAGSRVSAIGISPQNDNVRIVGLTNGGIFATTTGLTTLTSIDPVGGGSIIPDKYVARAVIDPASQFTAYVTLNGFMAGTTSALSHVWKITNLNTTPVLTAINGTGANTLPDIPVNALAVDTNDPTHVGISVLYTGTDIGVYASTDGGTNWVPFGTGLPRVAVFDMAIQPTSRILRIATHGRGLWEISLPGSPTAVKLEEFTAKAYINGQFIQWRTGYEANNLGFNLYREEGGDRKRLTPQLLAGSALVAGTGVSLTAGRSYAWWDRGRANKNVVYWLEEIDLEGKSIWHGPASIDQVGGQPASVTQADLLSRVGTTKNSLTVQVERSAEVSKGNGATAARQVDLSGAAAVKVAIRQEGWYRVDQPTLIAAGLDINVNPRTIKLFVDGVEQPIKVIGEQDGRFDANDSIEFYATGLDTPYSDTRVYWLTGGASPGMRISTAVAGKPGASSPSSFAYTAERKDRTIYFSALRNGERENFFGPIITADEVTQTLNLRQIDRNANELVIIEIALQGVTIASHQVRVSLNGSHVGDVLFANQDASKVSFKVLPSQLVEGDNEVRLIAVGGQSDVSLIDSIRITYPHTYTADGNNLLLTAGGGQSLTINGFTNNQVRVVDVTNAGSVQEVSGLVRVASGGYAITLTVPGSGQRMLMAFTNEQARQPISVSGDLPSRLKHPTNAADLVVITRREYFDALQPLVALRQSQKLAVTVVDVEDVFDEFSYGQKTPYAIKDFLSYARAHWKQQPSYVMFGGHASYDERNYLGLGDFDQVPTKLLDTTYMEALSDDWFADDNNDGLPEMAVGRLSFRTVDEATAIVSKIIAYETAGTSDSVLLVSDSPDGFNFRASNDRLKALLPTSLRVEEIDREELGNTEARSRLLEAINSGQKVVNYSGHGSATTWRAGLLNTTDAATLTNSKLPFFVTMTCLNGYLGDPAFDSLAEALVKARRAGAVAAWASSGLTSPGGQSLMNQEAFRLLFLENGQALRLGDVTMQAKAAILDPDVRRTWILFGDPTMKVK